MATALDVISRDFEEPKIETSNGNVDTNTKALRIFLLIFISIAFMVNNILYIYTWYVQTVKYQLTSENTLTHYGIFYASKDIALLILSPFTGALIDRIGFENPMIIGTGIMFLSSVVFVSGESNWLFIFDRILQGLGSAFADTSIMVITATLFRNERARTRAFGMVLGCTNFGFLLASPFIMILTSYLIKNRIAFLILTFISLLNGLLLIFVMRRLKKVQNKESQVVKQSIPIWKLLCDSYVIICGIALMLSQAVLTHLQYILPSWPTGYVVIESNVRMTWFLVLFSHILGIIFALLVTEKCPQRRWLMAAGGLTLEGICCLVLPFDSSYILVILACGIAFGVGLVRIAILPTLAHLMDIRHATTYGSAYSISYISYAIIDVAIPIILWNVIPYVGLTTLFMIIAISNILYAPVLFYLKQI